MKELSEIHDLSELKEMLKPAQYKIVACLLHSVSPISCKNLANLTQLELDVVQRSCSFLFRAKIINRTKPTLKHKNAYLYFI